MPWREQSRQQKKQQFLLLVAKSILLSLASILISYLFLILLLHVQDEKNSDWLKKIKLLQKQAAYAQQLSSKREALIAQIETLKTLEVQQRKIPTLITSLPKVLPDGIYLTNIKIESPNITINGKAEANHQIEKMIHNMEKTSIFIKPTITNQETENNDPPYQQKFTLVAKFK